MAKLFVFLKCLQQMLKLLSAMSVTWYTTVSSNKGEKHS